MMTPYPPFAPPFNERDAQRYEDLTRSLDIVNAQRKHAAPATSIVMNVLLY